MVGEGARERCAKTHDQGERQQRGTGLDRRIATEPDQAERQIIQCATEREVEQQRKRIGGGKIARADGPWRSSGDWWVAGLNPSRRSAIVNRQSAIVGAPWNCDEWDVTLTDGASYRISHAYDQSAAWFINGVLD